MSENTPKVEEREFGKLFPDLRPLLENTKPLLENSEPLLKDSKPLW